MNSRILEPEPSEELCNSIQKYLKSDKNEDEKKTIDFNSVRSCAKVCSVLWTSSMHLSTFEQISAIVLETKKKEKTENLLLDQADLDAIIKCLRHFVDVHSDSLLSNLAQLKSPILGEIVQLLLALSENE